MSMSTSIAFTALLALASALAPLWTDGEVTKGQFIVVFKPESIKADRDAHVTAIKANAIQDPTFSLLSEWEFDQLKAYAAIMSDAILNGVRADDKVVDYVQMNHILRAPGGACTPDDNVNHPQARLKVLKTKATPPLTHTSTQTMEATEASCQKQVNATWGIVRAAERSLNLNGQYSYSASGVGVDVYVMDSGIMTSHVDFEGRAIWGEDFVDPKTYTDGCGHGTHVAGTVMSKTYGVAKGARAIAVRVLDDDGEGDQVKFLNGLAWILHNHTNSKNKCVVNLSIGAPAVLPEINAAVVSLIQSGCSAIIASANYNIDACDATPASTPFPAVTVNAMDRTDTHWPFSDFGKCTDIYAPGVDITSTWIRSNTDVTQKTGTSQACPHVAGVAAKMLEHSASDPTTIAHALINTATPNVITNVPDDTPNKLVFDPCAPATPTRS